MTRDHKESVNEVILAMECAVGSGSVAVMANGRVVASTSGTDCSPSRAEEVLGIIDQLLKNADIAVNEIRRLAVSAGPGSYSGIRIGLATALGLKHSLGIPSTAIPLLEAMAASSGVNSSLVAAVPVGKKDIAWQLFGDDHLPIGEPELAPETEFLDRLRVTSLSTIFAHTDLTRLRDRVPEGTRLMDAGASLAEYLGTYASRNPGAGLSRPLYLRNRSHTGQILT